MIFNTHDILIDVYNKKYKKNITVDDIDKWNFFTKKVFKKIYSETCKRINTYELLDSMIPHWLFLISSNHDVKILTHHGNKRKKIETCLNRLGIRKGLEYQEIIKANGKKVKYDFFIFVDDNPEMIEDIQKYKHKYLLLFHSPWNKKYDYDYRNVFRVHNWSEVYTKIEQLGKITNI